MNYSIENEFLKITVSDLGAELISVISKENGCEYMWQGNKQFWGGQAPVLFPICCRLYGGYYTYEGNRYEMGSHGFARRSAFDKVSVGEKTISMTLKPNDDIRAMYPFDFTLTVKYKLEGKRVSQTMVVRNTSDKKELYFSVGGHPGFNLPLGGGEFEDWYLEFDCPAEPKQVIFTDTCFCTGEAQPYPLEFGRFIKLRHDLFDNDAVFLTDACRAVTLKSEKSDRSVRLEYPAMEILGIWHTPKAEAPFVCIEPMNGLPSRDEVVDDLKNKNKIIKLAAGDTNTSGFDIIFN